MKVGQLVRFVDHDAGGGFAPSPVFMGMVIRIKDHEQVPPAVEVLLFDGTLITEWQDELEVIK